MEGTASRWYVGGALVILVTIIAAWSGNAPEGETPVQQVGKFERFGLKTDTSHYSIDLESILSGGPGKDGIPSIDKPKFVSADTVTPSGDRGVLLRVGRDVRYYPYRILVWHEIVNDVVGGVPVAVTFCPLCDSAIVFNRRVGRSVLEFGVSGLLFESNLLMYDRTTESLWSQARGEAVVGSYLGTELELVAFQVLEDTEAFEKYPDARVLSEQTGFLRDYDRYPYGDYLDNPDILFPVSVRDQRYPAKELLYVVPVHGVSSAFVYDGIPQGTCRTDELVLERDGGEVVAYHDGAVQPGYFELWFSWVIHNPDGVIHTCD